MRQSWVGATTNNEACLAKIQDMCFSKSANEAESYTVGNVIRIGKAYQATPDYVLSMASAMVPV